MRKLKERLLKSDDEVVEFEKLQEDMIDLIRSYDLKVNTRRKDKVFTISRHSEDLCIGGSLEFAGLKYYLSINFYLYPYGVRILRSEYIGDSIEEFIDDLGDVVLFYNRTNYEKLVMDYTKLREYIKDDKHYRNLPAAEIYKDIIEQKQNNDDLVDIPDRVCKAYANMLASGYDSDYPLDTSRTESTNKL